MRYEYIHRRSAILAIFGTKQRSAIISIVVKLYSCQQENTTDLNIPFTNDSRIVLHHTTTYIHTFSYKSTYDITHTHTHGVNRERNVEFFHEKN